MGRWRRNKKREKICRVKLGERNYLVRVPTPQQAQAIHDKYLRLNQEWLEWSDRDPIGFAGARMVDYWEVLFGFLKEYCPEIARDEEYIQENATDDEVINAVEKILNSRLRQIGKAKEKKR